VTEVNLYVSDPLSMGN